MTTEKQIKWLKWACPIQGFIKLHSELKKNEEERTFEEEAAKDEFGGEDKSVLPDGKLQGPVYNGPQGLVPLWEGTMPTRYWNFWVGHTNFPINKEAVAKIEGSLGVETLDIFTPYRFRVGIGMMFKSEDVKKAVEKALKVNVEADGIEKIKEMLGKTHKFWSILILPKGKTECLGGKTQEEVELKAKGFADIAKRINSWAK